MSVHGVPESGLTAKRPPSVRVGGAWAAFALRWGSWVTIAVVLVLAASFVELSDELHDTEEPSARVLEADVAILRFLARFRRPWLNGVAMDLTALGSPILVAIFTVALASILLIKSDRRGATALVASSLASAFLTVTMKSLLERPRPDVVPRLVEVTGLSYPSGHSLGSAAVYLTAAFVIGRHVTAFHERVVGVGFAGVLVGTIGLSRVYLGVHFPSDVVGGILLGTASAVAMAALLRRLDRTPARPRADR